VDPITQILLTVGLNALITGVLVHYLQKSFEQKISIQNFEYQTKFSQIYKKRVETLEVLYQKYVSLYNDLNAMAKEAVLVMIWSVDEESIKPSPDYNPDDKRATAKFEDFKAYFEEKRVFLSETINSEIWDIVLTSSHAEAIISFILANAKTIADEPKDWLEAFGVELDEETKNKDINDILGELVMELLECEERLQGLYKSEAKKSLE
jgi:hypothetical protein